MSMCICLICRSYPVCMAGELDRLNRVNQQLRKALEFISKPPLCSKCDYQVKTTDCMHGKKEFEIAQEALVQG